MRQPLTTLAAVSALCGASAAAAAPAMSTPADRAFVAKVGQGGMFEVEAGRLAADKAASADVRDFAVMEVHDHTGVGDRLKAVSASEKVEVPAKLNAEFQGKLDRLRGLSGPAFDAAYMREMASLHAKDGAAFAQEAKGGGSADYRGFAGETHRIVARHIGAIHAETPPGA